VQADVADVDVVGLHASAMHLFHDDLSAVLGLFVGVGPGKAQHADGFPAFVITHAQLDGIGTGLALDTAHSHPVGTGLGQGGVADVYIDVRGPIVGGVVDLIEELFLDALLTDDAAAVGRLGDVKGVGGEFGNGKTQFVHAGNAAPVVHIVAPGPLAAALQKVAGHDAAGQIVPVVGSPAQLMLERRKEKGAVGGPAGDHHVGALVQAAFDPFVADVSVAVVDLVQNIVEVAVVIEVGEGPALFQQLGNLVFDVVAGDIADLIAVHLLELGPRADGVHTAGDV